MSITSLLELRLKPEAVADAPAVLTETLEATRAFEGNLGVDVLRDTADETHLVLVERWASLEADDAYRAWRQTPEGASRLGELVAAPPVLTRLSLEGGI
ncbi:antibiotic biosynthesis monooxygenase [Kineococcus gypseus]|uniref:putative quinol monooxygenase n=1 Tax=Kineococcus gypseus TaxID=1637102 RepID=UPI003D7E00D8